jgi:hypothetical protein
MKSKTTLIAVCLWVVSAVGLEAQLKTATLVANSRSITLNPATGNLADAGTVEIDFTTFDGLAVEPLGTSQGDFSGELQPRIGSRGVYQVDFATFSDSRMLDFGSATLTVPVVDSDGNGLPDFTQINKGTRANVSGNWTVESASSDSVDMFALSGRFIRNAKMPMGSYFLTAIGTNGIFGFNGTWGVVYASGSAMYQAQPVARIDLSLLLHAPDGGTRILTGSTAFDVNSENEVVLPGFSLLDNDGNAYVARRCVLSREGKKYIGELIFLDGDPTTEWPDYTSWVLEITDNNDSDGDGIPDLSDHGSPARFVPTGTPTLNGVRTKLLTVDPGDTLGGSFEYRVHNRQIAPGNLIAVVGLVDSAGEWVGGTPQVVYDGYPSLQGDTGTARWSGIAVPTVGGAYKLRFKTFMSLDESSCVNRFEFNPPRLDSGNAQGLVGTIEVTASSPWTLWWQHSSGFLAVWQMDGTNACSFQQKPIGAEPASPGWNPVGTADFNGDGQTDVLWQHTNGWVAVWFLDSGKRLGQARIGDAASAWKIRATGDLDGNGSPDIIWQHDDGFTAVWLMDKTNYTARLPLRVPPVDAGWTIVGTGDFNSDGHTDLLWEHTTGAIAVWFMAGTFRLGEVPLSAPIRSEGWAIVGTEDVNSDGHTDILWQHTSGALACWQLDGTTLAQSRRLNPPAVAPSWRVIGPK